jgi:CheY-like chemotaxis protein
MLKRKSPVVAKRKPSVLFVDDLQSVHDYTSRISKSIGARKRTAFNPKEAEKIISRRLRAVDSLLSKLTKQMALEKNPGLRKALLRKINYLKGLKQNPFDLIVSDVNMPHGNAVGDKFALSVRKRFPTQKILMHSDDQAALDHLREKGIDYSVKRNQHDNERELKTRIQQELWPKKFKRKLNDDDWF